MSVFKNKTDINHNRNLIPDMVAELLQKYVWNLFQVKSLTKLPMFLYIYVLYLLNCKMTCLPPFNMGVGSLVFESSMRAVWGQAAAVAWALAPSWAWGHSCSCCLPHTPCYLCTPPSPPLSLQPLLSIPRSPWSHCSLPAPLPSLLTLVLHWQAPSTL